VPCARCPCLSQARPASESWDRTGGARKEQGETSAEEKRDSGAGDKNPRAGKRFERVI
jgi:hypothetical protein